MRKEKTFPRLKEQLRKVKMKTLFITENYIIKTLKNWIYFPSRWIEQKGKDNERVTNCWAEKKSCPQQHVDCLSIISITRENWEAIRVWFYDFFLRSLVQNIHNTCYMRSIVWLMVDEWVEEICRKKCMLVFTKNAKKSFSFSSNNIVSATAKKLLEYNKIEWFYRTEKLCISCSNWVERGSFLFWCRRKMTCNIVVEIKHNWKMCLYNVRNLREIQNERRENIIV